MRLQRLNGEGWLVLLGGGEFSFGETVAVDQAWIDKTAAGEIGFVPAASGSADYGRHFADYLEERFGRRAQIIPLYRPRDARRLRNCERIAEAAAVYLGGGVAERLLETIGGSPCGQALMERMQRGAVIVAMAAAAQSAGQVARTLYGSGRVRGLGWLPGGVVEPNFNPAHDRRLRELLRAPDVSWGLGLPAGSAVLLGPQDTVQWVGPAFGLEDADSDLLELGAS